MTLQGGVHEQRRRERLDLRLGLWLVIGCGLSDAAWQEPQWWAWAFLQSLAAQW